MIDIASARERMIDLLRRAEARSDSFGSALPGYRERPKHHLVIVDEREYEFGWAFFWNTKEFVDSRDHRHALVGNAPIIVDRGDGQLYATVPEPTTFMTLMFALPACCLRRWWAA